ncbi:MAG: lipopolysaccharide heptosyltransferase II [Candidatus Thiodiazotropha sp.]
MLKIPEQDNPSILIVRLSAIGDIVFASPLIHALRQRYPKARISWLVQAESKALLEYHPELDEVVVWPRGRWQMLYRQRQWLALWREVVSFRRSLRQRGFDLALDVQGLLKSGLLSWFSGASQRIGLGSREGSQYLMSCTVKKGGEPRRIGSEYLYLAEKLGLPVDAFEMHVGLADEDQTYANLSVEKYQLNQGFVVICPFTTRPQKHWFNASWQALIEQLAERWQLPVVMLGGPGDTQAAAKIKVSAAARLINLVGETSLRQAAAVIARGSLVVGVDTGLTHIGIAMNRPTLCLFGSTRPYLDTTHENAQVIYHPRSCSPCKRKPTCNGSFDCMAEITAAEIVSRANYLPGFRGGVQ